MPPVVVVVVVDEARWSPTAGDAMITEARSLGGNGAAVGLEAAAAAAPPPPPLLAVVVMSSGSKEFLKLKRVHRQSGRTVVYRLS